MVEPSSTRQKIEQVSQPIILRLSSLPRPTVPLGTLLLVVIGLFSPLPIALPALLLVFVFFVWMAYLSWPVVSNGGQFLRGLMIGLIVTIGISRFW
ncbi:MAG: hypothetical protein QM650_12885 [Microlunatus sp.]